MRATKILTLGLAILLIAFSAPATVLASTTDTLAPDGQVVANVDTIATPSGTAVVLTTAKPATQWKWANVAPPPSIMVDHSSALQSVVLGKVATLATSSKMIVISSDSTYVALTPIAIMAGALARTDEPSPSLRC